MKIVKPFKSGGSIVLPLTEFIDLETEYLIQKINDKIIIQPAKKAFINSHKVIP